MRLGHSRDRNGEGPHAPLLLLAALAAGALAGCGASGDESTTPAAAAPAIRTMRASPASTPAGRPSGPVRSGQVQVQAGPFTDRVALRSLRFHPALRPRVSGSLVNRVDVSDVIVLELRADFYDSHGRRVGEGNVVFNDSEPFSHEALRFAVTSRRAAPTATSAVLTIPQLVNE